MEWIFLFLFCLVFLKLAWLHARLDSQGSNLQGPSYVVGGFLQGIVGPYKTEIGFLKNNLIFVALHYCSSRNFVQKCEYSVISRIQQIVFIPPQYRNTCLWCFCICKKGVMYKSYSIRILCSNQLIRLLAQLP